MLGDIIIIVSSMTLGYILTKCGLMDIAFNYINDKYQEQKNKNAPLIKNWKSYNFFHSSEKVKEPLTN